MKIATANIIKYLSILLFLCTKTIVFGQELIYADLDLNSGGVVHDVAYDKQNKLYIIVGEFSTVNGSAKNNIAFINSDDFSVNESSYFNIVSSINGPIYAVEFSSSFSGGTHRYDYYIGGEFDEINGISKNGCARLSYNSSGIYSPVSHSFYINTWNPNLSDFSAFPFPVVWTMDIFGDTVVIGGGFINEETGRVHLGAYLISTNEDILTYPNLAFDSDYNGIIHLSHVNNSLYVITYPEDLGGSGDFIKILPEGGKDALFTPEEFSMTGFYQIQGLEDSLVISLTSYTGDGGGGIGSELTIFNQTNGNEGVEHSFYRPIEPSGVGQPNNFRVYKNDIFIARIGITGGLYSLQKKPYEEDIGSVKWQGHPNANLNITMHSHLFAENNVLFASFDNLTSTLGESRTGLALYCLEPADIENFTVFDTTICQTDTVTYTVAQVDYADGYIWEYTGDGLDIGNTGAPENVSDTLYNSEVDAWTREIRFTPSFTPGDLKVTPFSTCNDNIALDHLIISNTIQISINTNPLPNVFAGLDTTLTCSQSEVVLHGHSDTLDVVYEWNTIDGDALSVFEGQDTTVMDQYDYVLTVLGADGCLNYDTVFVEFDTLRPTFDPVVGPFDLTCSDTVRSYLGVCNNLTDTTTFWVALASNDTLSNPVDVTLPGQYQFYTINNGNGCIDSLTMPILVYLNQPSPNIEIYGYDELPIDSPLDTIDCNNPILTFQCYSDTASTILNWVEADSTDPSGDIIHISEAGNYYILARNTENGCFNYTGINIAEDFSKPNVILPIVSSINCSNDSLILDGSTIFTDTIMEWTGDGISPSPNPVSIFDPGWYYLTITKNDNGCSEIDSLEIFADNSIDVFAGNDTVVCNESLLYLTASYGGEITGITYLWDNGATDESTFYTAGTDDFAILEVFGDDGCYGFDTAFIAIPPVPVIDFEAFQPCGEGATGSIIASPISGLAPFEYSANEGATFQTSPALTGLDYGTYSIWVKDSLNCLYNYEVVIDETSDLPIPQFLFSTFNFQMDTVIVIDISNPPTDSVDWQFSSEITYVGEQDGFPLIALPDTGSFLITMNAYYGSCLVSVTKEIFVTEFDSTYATYNNQNGIRSINLYPNPTTGAFTVEVEFYKKQRASIAIQDMIGYVYEERSFEEVDSIIENFEISLDAINGTYVFRLISEYDSAYITFILSR